MGAYGYEGDPNDEARRRYLDAPEGGAYGYGFGPGDPAPPEPPRMAPIPPPSAPAAGGGAYGTDPIPALVEHQERGRMGAVQQTEPDTNPYGYPEPLKPFRAPQRPSPGWGSYLPGRGLAGAIIKSTASTQYEKERAAYEDAIAQRRQEEDEYERRYKEAQGRETRAEREQYHADLKANRDTDNARMEAERLAREQATRDAEARHIQEQQNREERDAAYERRLSEQERHNRVMEGRPTGSDRPREKKFYPDLWKQAQASTATRDPKTRMSVPASDDVVGEKYRSLVKAAGLDEGDEGGDGGAPVTPEAAKKLEGKRVRNKRTQQWGTIRNGKFVPEAAPRR